MEGEHTLALEHLQKALQLVRSNTSTLEIDEGVAISAFLLAHCNVMGSRYRKKYVDGIVNILTKLNSESMRQSLLSPLTIDPLTMLIWRMAKRINFISSIACGEVPVLPSSLYHGKPSSSLLQKHNQIHRECIQSFTDKSLSSVNAEWGKAWFRLDSFIHRGRHVSVVVYAVSQSLLDRVTESQVRELINNRIAASRDRHE